MTIREVAQLFLDKNYTSAPVMSAAGEIMGVVDEFGLIKAKLVQRIETQSRDKIAHHTEYLLPATTVTEDTKLPDVIKEMIKAPNHRLLVLNRAQGLVGIISSKDILKFVIGVQATPGPDLKQQLQSAKESLAKVETELQQTKGRLEVYKDIVMENPSMIHSVDSAGKILMANKKMHIELGYDPNELLGKTMFDLYAQSMHHEAVQGLKKVEEDGKHQSTLTTMMKKSGEKVRVDIASAALHDDKGHFVGTISVSRVIDSDILLQALHGVFRDKQP